MVGLNPNIRLVQPEAQKQNFDGGDIVVDDAEEHDNEQLDDKGNTIEIKHPDGSVTISLDGTPLKDAPGSNHPKGWFDNLVEQIDDIELGRIAEDLLRGVSDDLASRKEWVENRALGLRMLGLMIELPSAAGASEGVEGQSRVRHPLLLEAVLRFQANARSEMLPTDGPVKIRDDNNNATLEVDQEANDLEKDFNHYLTATATEYYPDTDRMLLMLGFGGTAFKKIYFNPLHNRPFSESVDANDLIVNNAATDLGNARRITHKIMMRPSLVKRMQILGIYRDVQLSMPKAKEKDSVELQKEAIQGTNSASMNPDDNDREIYEIYCELNIKGFEHKHKGKISGLDIPYRVTIDTSSREVLSVVRNYDEDTKELPEARQNFVKYTFVPGLGFYDIGLLNILGNTTNAITAAWREMLDAGMFANFPGFLFSDSAGRQQTNIFRVPPGGGAQINTNGLPIQQAVMPLPYKDPSTALMTLVDNMATTGQRIGGTSEMQVGEGRSDAPVGTTLALIEQATKMLNAVHKRMHSAQAQEFQLLAKCFKENPESFWQRNRKPARKWDEQTFLQALEEADLVPQADPNTSSHSQRLMKVVALKQLQSSNPTLYDAIAVDKAALKAIGWSNPEQFMAPPAAQAEPPPEVKKEIEELKIKHQDADSRSIVARSTAAKNMAEAQRPPEQPESSQDLDPLKVAKLHLDERHLAFQEHRSEIDDVNRDKDRQADLLESKMTLEGDILKTREQHHHELNIADKEHEHEEVLAKANVGKEGKKDD